MGMKFFDFDFHIKKISKSDHDNNEKDCSVRLKLSIF